MGSYNIAALLEKLDTAFGHLSRPSDENIVHNNSGYDLECNEVKERFRGHDWRNLSLKDLEFESAALAFFSPEAFRFFLPAYVRVSILHYPDADVIPESIVGSLTRPKDPTLLNYYSARIGTLDKEQRSCLIDFIEFLRECHADEFFPGELEAAQDSLETE